MGAVMVGDTERRRKGDAIIDLRLHELHTEIISMGQLIDSKLEAIITQTKKTNGCVQDHENRLRSLERYAFLAIGGLAVLEIFLRVV